VVKGELEYQINEPYKDVYILDISTVGIVEPTIKHQVKPLTKDVQFCVEFYKRLY